MSDVFTYNRRNELQEVYKNSLNDEDVSDKVRAMILLRELSTYEPVDSQVANQYRAGRYLFDKEQGGSLVYMMAVEGLVGLFNTGKEKYVIAITEKGEEASKKGKIPGFGHL